MTATLTQLRTQVRGMADLDAVDLPDSVIDQYAKEGFQRIYALERRWPFLQQSYTLNTVAGTRAYTLASIGDVREIISITEPSVGGQRYSLISYDEAERVWLGNQDTASKPLFFALWAKAIHLYPKPDAVYTLTIRAYRNPTYTWLDTPYTTVIDLDEWFHAILPYFILGRVYQRQEDAELSALNMNSFDQGVAYARLDLMKPSSAQPMIMSGGTQRPSYERWMYNMGLTIGQ